MFTYAITFIASLLLSLLLTPVIKRAALYFRVLDSPGLRKVHDVKIPRLGGLAIYISFMIVYYATILLGYIKVDESRFSPHFLRGYAIGGSIIVFLGAWDDVRQLRPLLKLFLQILAASITVIYGMVIKLISVPYLGEINLGLFAYPFTLFWIVGITNAINLIDGLDGLAGGVTFIASMTLFLIALQQGKTETALFSIVLAGSLVGFLRYNFNPAQIFLGDSGALFLGYSLANFSVMGTMKSSTAVALLIPIIALGFPIMDTFLAMLRRYARALREGKGPLAALSEIGTADKQHMHHKLMELGYTHKRTVVLLYGLCLVFGLFAFILTAYRDRSVAAILFFVGLMVFVMVRLLGYIEFRGLKEGNFLEQYLSKIGTAVKQKKPDSDPGKDAR